MKKRGQKIAFIGTGFMARAMIGGIVGSGLRSPDAVLAVNPVEPESAAEVNRLFGVGVGGISDLDGADTVVFAVKPQQFDEALAMYRDHFTADKLYLSIMAGVTLARLEKSIPGAPVVRLMPNLALSVGKSATAFAPGSLASGEDVALVEELFSVMGVVLKVDEELISSVTGLSGSGPAYFCLLAEALAAAAEEKGMDRATADALALQTLIGTAELLEKTGVSAAELRRRVTSKKGTTEAGLLAMTAAGFEKAAADGFNAARIRCDELSSPDSAK
ncbi:MAG: pyrroline-5-carboxylate reductase [Clostridia bacterium]|nr:pyrroline-5-carboxylate reductase [Clostridia bacterium]